MRTRDPEVFLFDALAAAEAITRFMGGCSQGQFQSDEILRSAVERQFEIMGEALNRVLKANQAMVEFLPEARKVIAFRNVLAHGSDAVVDETVYSVATADVPLLAEQLRVHLKDFR